MRLETNTRIILASRPSGEPRPENFRLEQAPIPARETGRVLVRTRFLSLDPYMRGRMNAAASYAAPVEIGAVMEGEAVAEVVDGRDAGLSPGALVLGRTGWQTFASLPATEVRAIEDVGLPVESRLGVLGMPGFTAWAGLHNIGRPSAGETIVVAAASGPVGSTVGQIARLRGARAVGVAGGERKRKLLLEHFGFDVALDHRSPGFAAELSEACPDGVDVYFENVGGKVWDAVFPLLNRFARVPVCGLIAHYNDVWPYRGPDRLPVVVQSILSRSLRVQGFIQRDFSYQRPAFEQEMVPWLQAGRVRRLEHVVDGLEQAPTAFAGLLRGENVGKLIIRV